MWAVAARSRQASGRGSGGSGVLLPLLATRARRDRPRFGRCGRRRARTRRRGPRSVGAGVGHGRGEHPRGAHAPSDGRGLRRPAPLDAPWSYGRRAGRHPRRAAVRCRCGHRAHLRGRDGGSRRPARPCPRIRARRSATPSARPAKTRRRSCDPPPPWLAWTSAARTTFAQAAGASPGDGGALLPGLAIGDETSSAAAARRGDDDLVPQPSDGRLRSELRARHRARVPPRPGQGSGGARASRWRARPCSRSWRWSDRARA